ncbi:hypothetical protein GCM10010260_81160 [Streptomyces filipinensis]|uniref:Uncharacterized protein n=1 Tax=Streptomyces filipinensis TaxID=66887 RepID=A0A918IK24_9ACTN|nr:hypothetical protein GCM10010260_81160 [Streptomyces filipinensis]
MPTSSPEPDQSVAPDARGGHKTFPVIDSPSAPPAPTAAQLEPSSGAGTARRPKAWAGCLAGWLMLRLTYRMIDMTFGAFALGKVDLRMRRFVWARESSTG